MSRGGLTRRPPMGFLKEEDLGGLAGGLFDMLYGGVWWRLACVYRREEEKPRDQMEDREPSILS